MLLALEVMLGYHCGKLVSLQLTLEQINWISPHVELGLGEWINKAWHGLSCPVTVAKLYLDKHCSGEGQLYANLTINLYLNFP